MRIIWNADTCQHNLVWGVQGHLICQGTWHFCNRHLGMLKGARPQGRLFGRRVTIRSIELANPEH